MYEGKVYRPPSEARSLVLQTTTGCPYNQCYFCMMYNEKKCRIKSVEEIKEDVKNARKKLGDSYQSVFLADGNSILIKTEDLLEIIKYIKRYFPQVKRITTYGSARYVVLKTVEELEELREAGLTRIHTGMESGDREVLKRINKGTVPEEIIKAGKKVKDAGMELSEYYLVGVGGERLTENHARNSAAVINEIDPEFIRLRTFIPLPDTVLYDRYQSGKFRLLDPHQALKEIKIFIENLQGIESELLSDHVSNYWDIKGKLPGDKEKMVAEVEKALKQAISEFRDPARGFL